MKKAFRLFLLIFILAALFLPAVQKAYPFLKVQALRGSYTLSKPDTLTFEKYWSGQFQQAFEKALEDNENLKPLMVRINNEIEFDLFRTVHAEDVTCGKEDYLYEAAYINSYLGRDFAGEVYIDDQLRKLRFLQDELKKENKDLLMIIAPGKGSYYPQYIPDKFEPQKRERTNYDYFIQRIKELGINCIDFKHCYDLWKDTASYTLYPKCSIHWSTYGYTFAQDSVIRYIENLRHIDAPDMVVEGLEVPDTMRGTDYDIGEGLNLMWRIKTEKTAYPVIKFKNGPGKVRPKVLTIGDSFYNCFWEAGIFPNVFEQYGFWYYNKEVLRDKDRENVKVENLNLRNEIQKNEVIMLFSTERNLGRFPYGFIDNLYELYAPKLRAERIAHYRDMILKDPRWKKTVLEEIARTHADSNSYFDGVAVNALDNEFKQYMQIREARIQYLIKCMTNQPDVVKQDRVKAHERGISVAEMIGIDARWLYENNELVMCPEKMELKKIEDGIWADPATLKGEEKKAKERGVTLAEMVMTDVFWVYNNAREKKYAEICKIESDLRSTPEGLKYISEKAAKVGFSVNAMIKADALFIYNDRHKEKK